MGTIKYYNDDDVVVVNKIIGNFLANKVFDTPKQKFALISAIHKAEREENNPLVLEEEDYAVILKAVVTGKYVVDTGLYYVNTGQPVGKEEFLAISSVETTDDGKEKYIWEFETLQKAKLFTRDELATIVPRAYRQGDFILMENQGKELWGR